MRPSLAALTFLCLFTGSGCGQEPKPETRTLAEARQGFHTRLLPQRAEKEPVETAPAKVFRTLKYPTPGGQLAAYLTPDPGDGKKHPAIVWITGGDCNSIGDVWSPSPPENDQTAAAYRQAGIVMMFPSFRGGNANPGAKEGFLGEVDDVLAAADFLAKQPYVDAKRIYLGGHSTGGTLALLTAELSARFRGVFAFGPVADVSDYDPETGFVPADLSRPEEIKLRSPGNWLASVRSPTWVIEGTRGNIEPLQTMERLSRNSWLHFIQIKGASHFATLSPTNALIARKILQDTGEPSALALPADEVNHLFVP